MEKIKEILIGTNNEGKYREICDLLPKKIKKYSKLRNLQKLPSVTASVISIFFNQIIYIVKKILKIK